MTVEQLKKRMEQNGTFNDYVEDFEKLNDTKVRDDDTALLRTYENWILAEGEHCILAELEKGERALCVVSMQRNEAFLAYFKARNAESCEKLVSKADQLDEKSQLQMISLYRSWLQNEFDDTVVGLSSLGVDKVLQFEKRREMDTRFGSLLQREYKRAKEEGFNLQWATQEKAQAKRDVMTFLSAGSSSKVTRFNRALFGKTDKTTAGIGMLREEINRCQKRMEQLKGKRDHFSTKKQEKEKEVIEGQIASLETRIEEASAYIDRLEQSKALKKSFKKTWQERTGEAEKVFKETDTEFIRMSKDLIKGVKTTSVTLHELEEQIVVEKRKMEGFIQKIPELYEEQEREMNRLRRMDRTGTKDPIRQKYLTKLNIEAPQVQKVRQSIAERARLIEETEFRHRLTADELALLDAKYNAMFDRTQEALEDHEHLNRLRAMAKDELEWLQSLDRVDKALNVYCSSASSSFELFLSVGQIAAGQACGPIGGTAVMSMGLLAAPMTYGVSGLISTALLASIEAYDTGQFGISLKLGISWGAEFELATSDSLGTSVGLALVYDASIQLGDTRGFKTVCTLTLQATAKAEIPKVLDAALTMELIKEKTEMRFKDVYQWAAWLGQKWANARAWVAATSLYKGSGRFGQPTPRDLERLREVAEISLKQDKQTRDMLEKVFKYMEEPIIRCESKEKFAGVEAEVSAAEFFTLGGSLERTCDPTYIRRHLDPHLGDVYEEEKEGKQVSRSLTVAAGLQVVTQYDNVSKDPNPDAEGKTLTFTISLPLFDQSADWVKHPDQDPSGGAIGNWVQNHLTPVADKIKSITSPDALQIFKAPFAESLIWQASTQVALGTVEICIYKSPLSTGASKWVLLYWRPIFSTSTSIERTVPLSHGFNLVMGGTISLKRTYREQIGDNTIAYIKMVYDGLMNISAPGDDANPRPKEARGSALWERYVKAHKQALWRMMYNMTKETWVADEVKDMDKATGPSLTRELGTFMPSPSPRSTTVLPSHLKNLSVEPVAPDYPDFNQQSFDKGLKAFVDFLEKIRTGKYKNDKDEGWKPVEITGGTFNWSINPYSLAKEFARTRTTQYKLEKSVVDGTTALGHRKGLKEQIMAEVHMVPDEEAPNCMNKKCNAAFTFFNRRHHCRECGGVFCGKCTTHTLELPHRSIYEKVRVCDACYTKLTAAKEEVTQSVRSSHHESSHHESSEHPKTSPVHQPTGSLLKQQPVKVEATTVPKQTSLLVTGVSKPPEGLVVVKKTAPKMTQKQVQTLLKSGKPLKQKKEEVVVNKPQKLGVHEWYTDDHINWLLNHYLQHRQDTSILSGISAHLHGGATILENLQDQVEQSFVQGLVQWVVPVNVHGNHWVGVYMDFRSGNYTAPRVIHVDPMAGQPTRDLRNALNTTFPGMRLQVTTTRYQVIGDTYNCGPWTVALLEHMANNVGALPALNAIDITARRAQDQVLLG